MTKQNDVKKVKPSILKVEKITKQNDVKKVKCKECGKEYELNPGENHSDFQCECGGELESIKYTLWEKLFILLLVFIILLLLFFVFSLLFAGGL